MRQDCYVCAQPVTLSRRGGWLRQVTGWEEPRRQGGANKIVQRRTTGEVAHVGCVAGLEHTPNQEAMTL